MSFKMYSGLVESQPEKFKIIIGPFTIGDPISDGSFSCFNKADKILYARSVDSYIDLTSKESITWHLEYINTYLTKKVDLLNLVQVKNQYRALIDLAFLESFEDLFDIEPI